MQTVETILGNKPSIRKVILLEYVKTPDGILVKEIEKRLGVSGLDKNHLTKLEEFGILEIHHIKVRRPAGRFKTETMCTDKGYRLKQDPDTFAKLLSIFIGTEHLEDFLYSPYVNEMEDIKTLFQIVIDMTSEHMKPVQSLVEILGLPSTKESLAAHQSQRMSNLVANMTHAMEQLKEVASTMPPHSTFGDIKRKFKEEHSDS